MKDALKLFGWLFLVSISCAVYRLHTSSLPLILLTAPILALFQLLLVHDALQNKPPSHWFFKLPAVPWLKDALHKALSLPSPVRALVVLACIFGGLWLSKLAAHVS